MQKWKLNRIFQMALLILAGYIALRGFGLMKSFPAASGDKPERIAQEVRLYDSGGKQVGTASLAQLREGVEFRVRADGLPPGKHGFHVHVKPICELPAFESTGGHLNPAGRKHGFLNAKGPHAGDLPNLVADARGHAEMRFVTDRVTLRKGEPHSLYAGGGTSLVIHEGEDDYFTDPAGGSGKRIVCGAIKLN